MEAVTEIKIQIKQQTKKYCFPHLLQLRASEQANIMPSICTPNISGIIRLILQHWKMLPPSTKRRNSNFHCCYRELGCPLDCVASTGGETT